MAYERVLYALARLPADGMIRIDSGDIGWRWGTVLHRGDVLRSTTPDYDTREEAKQALEQARGTEDNPEDLFIVEFDSTKTLARLWFSSEQRKAGLHDRLDHFKSCYGKYPVCFTRTQSQAKIAA